MTAPVTGLCIDIRDDGAVFLSAADWSAEGHLWAIERRPVTIGQLRAVAKILGPDAYAGVESRLLANRDRLRQRVDTMQARVREAEQAQEALDELDAAFAVDGES
jgi:hypothetical protein